MLLCNAGPLAQMLLKKTRIQILNKMMKNMVQKQISMGMRQSNCMKKIKS